MLFDWRGLRWTSPAGPSADNHPDLAVVEQEVAEALARLGEHEEAAVHARIALEILSNADSAAPSSIRRAELLAGIP
jgi:Uma2 family endonuclease